MLKLHIGHHFWGWGNFGDDLTMAGFLMACTRSGRAMSITCAIPAANRASQSLRFPQVTWLALEDANEDELVRDCDVWLGVGDTPFQIDSGPWLLDHLIRHTEMCKRHAKPMYFLGVGVESAAALANAEAQAIMHAADFIWTRDPTSAALLADAGARNVRPAADLANIILAAQAVEPVRPGSIGYAVHFENPAAFSVDEIARALLDSPYTEQYWLVQEVRPLYFSEHTILGMLSPEARHRVVCREPDFPNDTVAGLLGAWPFTETMVSSRYHAALTGAWRGARLVMLERSSKLTGLSNQLQIDPAFRLADFLSADTVLAAARDCVPVDRALLEHFAEDAETAAKEFFERVSA